MNAEQYFIASLILSVVTAIVGEIAEDDEMTAVVPILSLIPILNFIIFLATMAMIFQLICDALKREPVCYLLNSARPIGLEPTIYLTKPDLDPNGLDENPWHPDVIECYSFQDALSRILHFNIGLALSDFKIVK